MEISLSAGSSLTSSYPNSHDDYHMIGLDEPVGGLPGSIFTVVVAPDIYIFSVAINDIASSVTSSCETSPRSIFKVTMSNADSIDMG